MKLKQRAEFKVPPGRFRGGFQCKDGGQRQGIR